MLTPRRPPSVPASAVFVPDGAFWELRERNERGEVHGLWCTFTPEGMPRSRGCYENGKLEGYLSRFTDGEAGSPGESEGSGIAGMRERAVALGGSLQAGPLPNGGFLVTVSLPVAGSPAQEGGAREDAAQGGGAQGGGVPEGGVPEGGAREDGARKGGARAGGAREGGESA